MPGRAVLSAAGRGRARRTSVAKLRREGRVDRQGTLKQELPDVLEAAVAGQINRRVLAVVIEAFETAHVTDLGVGHGDAPEARRSGQSTCGHVSILTY